MLTESTARKYFGQRDPIGETITLEHHAVYTVTAVIQDLPPNTHFDFEFILSKTPPHPSHPWNHPVETTYLALHEETDPETLEAKFPDFIAQHRIDQEGAIAPQYTLSLQPLTDIHLNPTGEREAGKTGPVQYLYLFSAAAMLILLIACINYMNLATARSARRAREIGVRKVLGARRGQIIQQMLGETFLVSLVAFGFALVLTWLLLPSFNTLLGLELRLNLIADPQAFGVFLGVALVVGLLSGSYPALFLARFHPAFVLKGSLPNQTSGGRLRRTLVVTQFAASMGLIVATLVVVRQMDYVRSVRLDQLDEQVVVVSNLGWFLNQEYPAFQQQMLTHPSVVSVATGSVPGRIEGEYSFQDEQTEQTVTLQTLFAGYGYLETLGLDMLAGTDFSNEPLQSDQLRVIYNETALHLLGLEGRVGESIAGGHLKLVGAVQDFHVLPLHERISPVEIRLMPDYKQHILVRFHEGRLQDGLAHLQETWNQFVPDRPVLYHFLDEQLDRAYRAELRLGNVFGGFAVIAIFIACLGLFGLAAYTAEQRTKEIGIRKVLGATASSIVVLLSKDFVRLLLFAVIFATPVAYLAMRRWLDNFAYRIEVGFGLFVGPALLMLALALLTVSYQAWKIARTEPAKALRYE